MKNVVAFFSAGNNRDNCGQCDCRKQGFRFVQMRLSKSYEKAVCGLRYFRGTVGGVGGLYVQRY